jgi:hypothetical protein
MSATPSSRTERRHADRRDYRIPIRLRAGAYTICAETENLSRAGALLRVPLTELHLPLEANLAEIGAVLQRVVGERSSAEFRPDELGGLITRTLRVVRIARPDRFDPWVEVGFALGRPLTDEETGYLRIDLPRVRRRESGLHALGDMAAAAPVPDLEMVVCATSAGGAEPMRTSLSELSATGFGAAVPDFRALPVDVENGAVIPVLGAISRAYTCTPTVIALRGTRPIWSGSARMHGIGIDPSSRTVHLQFAFARELGESQRAVLGVA